MKMRTKLSGILTCFILMVQFGNPAMAFGPLISYDSESPWRGIARVEGNMQCTGFLIDMEQGDFGPAYVVTNGHCVMDWANRGNSMAVIMNQSASRLGYKVTFDYFYNSTERLELPVKTSHTVR